MVDLRLGDDNPTTVYLCVFVCMRVYVIVDNMTKELKENSETKYASSLAPSS